LPRFLEFLAKSEKASRWLSTWRV